MARSGWEGQATTARSLPQIRRFPNLVSADDVRYTQELFAVNNVDTVAEAPSQGGRASS